MRDFSRAPRGRLLASWLLLLLLLSPGSPASAQDSQRIPQFRDYPAESPVIWLPGPVDFSDPDVRKYRTRLTEASKQWANFAGHHVLTTWGCGTQCQTGAILDLPKGKVTFLPTVCCWGDVDDNFKPFEFRKESRLVVLSGQLNEQGDNAVHFFEFRDGRLTPVKSIPRPGAQVAGAPAGLRRSLLDTRANWQTFAAPLPLTAQNSALVAAALMPYMQAYQPSGPTARDREALASIVELVVNYGSIDPVDGNPSLVILYNSLADLFALVSLSNTNLSQINFLSGTAAAAMLNIRDGDASALFENRSRILRELRTNASRPDFIARFQQQAAEPSERIRIGKQLFEYVRSTVTVRSDPCADSARNIMGVMSNQLIPADRVSADVKSSYKLFLVARTSGEAVFVFGDTVVNRARTFLVMRNTEAACSAKSQVTRYLVD